MTPSQTAELLTYCAAFDRRTIGKADVLAWHTVLAGIDLDAAKDAVNQHYSTQTRWIMPADIITTVRAVRRDRLERHTEGEPPAGDTGDAAYKAALAAERKAIADGRTTPVAVPALPPGQTIAPYEGRGRALLNSVGREAPSHRPEFSAPCPYCHAPAGHSCTNGNGQRRRDAHPTRIDAARALAAGEPPVDHRDIAQEMERRRAASAAALTQQPHETETEAS